MNGHQVKHPRRLLAVGTGPASAEDRLPLVDNFCLNKKIAESRMQRIRNRRFENHFSVACHFNRPAGPRPVGYVDAAQFNVIFGRNADLSMCIELLVTAAEFRPPRKLLRSFVFF
jgi:hypothetical protein